ncbi:MAG: pyrroloquinoline quinone biosynthesis protein PqqB [Myxococcota bacterium]
MKARVLGSCAGGGLPQWNCGCSNCVRARQGDPALPPRLQPSLAVSADGERWSLLNASPDIRHQLAAFPALHPRPGTRDLPLDSVLLTNADLDHVLGLLVLREALCYRILSTRWVRDALLDHNAVFGLVAPVWSPLRLDEPLSIDREGRLEARLFPVPGKVPGHLKERVSPHAEATVGVRLTDTESGRRLAYVPGTRALDSGTWAEVEAADVAFVDGTFFTNDELQKLRPGAPDALAMAHVPVTGSEGTLDLLAGHPGRCLYTHLNNTNPLLDAGSTERARVVARGVEVASDGLELEI